MKGKGLANNFVSGSQHLDSLNCSVDPKQNGFILPESEVPDFDANLHKRGVNAALPQPPRSKAQDMHKCSQVILASHEEMQKADGVNWDFNWSGKLLHCNLVPFVLFCAVDGKEADKLCGQCTSKTEDVQNLCRFCHCPTNQSGVACRDDRMKTQSYIVACIKNRRTDLLKSISQQDIWNAFHYLQFGKHNYGGIHQACPPDPLHWFLLGQLKYSRQNFFFQLGEDSKMSKEFNAIATHIGMLLKRQSVKDLPRVTFNRGIQDGKCMAHEMQGVVLLMSGGLRCTRGRNLMLQQASAAQKEHFPDEDALRRWMLLLETQVELGEWFKLPTHEVATIERCGPKFRECMNMVKCVGNRSEKMGCNTSNHHMTKHWQQCILDFGPPDGLDTKSMEKDHKPDKKTAQRTNKQALKFNQQIATKQTERQAVCLGMEEMNGNSPCQWHCCQQQLPVHDAKEAVMNPFEPVLTGVKVRCFLKDGNLQTAVTSKMKGKDGHRHDEATRMRLKVLIQSLPIPEITVWDCLKVHDTRAENESQLCRASPLTEGKPWHDWAVFNLCEQDNPNDPSQVCVPTHLKCFTDLRDLPLDNIAHLVPGICALGEKAVPHDDLSEHGRSELWDPWVKMPHPDPVYSGHLNKMDLLNANRIVGPVALIPDLDNTNRRACLSLMPRALWGEQFTAFLKGSHSRDFDFPEDDPPDPNINDT